MTSREVQSISVSGLWSQVTRAPADSIQSSVR